MTTLIYYFIWANFIIASIQFPVTDEEEASMYLEKYGYIDEKSDTYRSSPLVDQRSISTALKEFQRFAGINETGVLDNETLRMMNTPRCGVKDKVGPSFSARRKRYTLQGSKWAKNNLTYRITKYPTIFKDKAKVEKAIAKAWKVWSSVSPLTVQEKKRGRISIDIRFEKGEHGDKDPFDGPGNTLAHAFFPQYGGDAHFDDEEKWTTADTPGTNLLQVAAHEFGHSLGLSHSDDRKAIMAPYYRGFVSPFTLGADDINAIQAIYGTEDDGSPTPEKRDPTGPPPDTTDAADLCQDSSIDAITRTQNGSSYMFKGDFYWKVLSNGTAAGYPRRINEDWDGLEGDLDAALTWSNGKTYFFKGGRYWRFTNRDMDSGYPKLIEFGFEGVPDRIDAVFVWSGNGKTYFFKGDKYWRYDSNSDVPVSSEYPKAISNWGLPANINAAFQWENSKTYFFKEDKYYRFNDISFEVYTGTPSFPRSTSFWWFNCQSVSQKSNPQTTTASYLHELVIRDNNTIIRIDSNLGTI